MLRSIQVSATIALATMLGAATAATATAAVAAPSAPRPAAYASLRGVITRISTGKSARFTYTVANLSAGQTAQLQRTFGTTRAWREVEHLTARRNAALAAPALGTLGTYAYRVAIVRAGKLVKSTAPVTVHAFGNVSLTPFNDGGGTEQVGSTVFSFTDEANAGGYPQYAQNQAFTATSCRSLSVRYAGDADAQGSGETSYLEFVQSSLDPVYAQTPAGIIGSVTVALDGGPLYLDAASGGNNIVFSITGSCYTVSGTR